MSSMKLLLLILGLVTMVITRTSARSLASKITCSAGRFEVGQTGSVTCYFHKDIQASRDGFDMTARFFDTLDNAEYDILNCNWFPNWTLHCLNKNGFSLRNNDASDRLTVDISPFTDLHTGVYRCHVIDDATPTEPCYLLSKPSLYSPLSTQQSSSLDNGWTIVSAIALCAIVVLLCRRKDLRCNRLSKIFSNFRRRRQTPSDGGADSPERIPMLSYQQQTFSSSKDSRKDTNNNPRETFLVFRGGNQTLADYEADLKTLMPQTHASSSSDNEERGSVHQFELYRSRSETAADYEAEPPENRTTNLSDNKERAEGFNDHETDESSQQNNGPDQKDQKFPQEIFNIRGMARKPYTMKPNEGLKRQRSYENLNFPK